MSFHRSCCCKDICYPQGMAVSFLDLYRSYGDCGDCPIEGGCNGSYIDGVEILEGQIDCYCQTFWQGKWEGVPCPYIPCSAWPGPGTFEFYHCNHGCSNTDNPACQENSNGLPHCSKACPCAVPYRLVCNENAQSCETGSIERKCCARLHVYYGAYHDGEKYWLSDNPMTYFNGNEEIEGVNCKRECGAATLATAPVCQGNGLWHCPGTSPSHWCGPVGCCEHGSGDSDDPVEGQDCGNCPFCSTPSDAPFCCSGGQQYICEFFEQLAEGGQGKIDNWQDWCEYKFGPECVLGYEPYYWKFCGIGGWGLSTGDVHVSRMYTEDDDEDSPTFGERIPCNNNQGCDNTALYDIYNLTGGGGGVEPYVPHVLILYAQHIRVGSQSESRSSMIVEGWWVSCTSSNNNVDLPIEGNNPDCHCEDSDTIGACCFYGEEDGCFNYTEETCEKLGGNWQGPGGELCEDDVC